MLNFLKSAEIMRNSTLSPVKARAAHPKLTLWSFDVLLEARGSLDRIHAAVSPHDLMSA